jgi:opacity protein-like surface antigen
MKRSLFVGVSTVVVPPGCGWYISFFGGLSLHEDFKTDYNSSGTDYSEALDTKEGFVIGGAAGTCFMETFRADVEVAYSNNDAEYFTGFPNNVSGDLDTLTVLGNLWYDFDTGTMFKPYIGGGAGIGIVWGDYNYDPPLVPPGQIVKGHDLGFAFQLGAGVNIPVSQSVDFTIGYRFKGILDLHMNSTFLAATDHEGDLYSHNVIAGIVWKLPPSY